MSEIEETREALLDAVVLFRRNEANVAAVAKRADAYALAVLAEAFDGITLTGEDGDRYERARAMIEEQE